MSVFRPGNTTFLAGVSISSRHLIQRNNGPVVYNRNDRVDSGDLTIFLAGAGDKNR